MKKKKKSNKWSRFDAIWNTVPDVSDAFEKGVLIIYRDVLADFIER